jgi:hypothetical protein
MAAPVSTKKSPRFRQRPPAGRLGLVELNGRVLKASQKRDGTRQARVERARTLLAALRTTTFEVAPQSPAKRPFVEAAAPVGKAVYVDNKSMQAQWAEVMSGRAVSDPGSIRFDDAGVVQLVTTFFHSALSGYSLGGNANDSLVPDWANLLRNFIRASELSTHVNVSPEVWAMPWPATEEAAALLRRAAKAFGVAEDAIRFGKGTLAQPNLLAEQPAIVDGVEISGPVGSATFQNDFDANWNALNSGKPVPRPDHLRFDDATVKQAVSSVSSNRVGVDSLGADLRITPDGLWMLRNFIRAAELGAPISVAPDVWKKAWPTTPAMAALLRRASNAFKVDPASIRFGQQTLADYDPQPDFRGPAKVEARRQVGQGSYDAGFAALHFRVANNHPVSPEALALDDGSVTVMAREFYRNTLHGSYLGVGTTLSPEALTQLRNFVRAAELGQTITVMPDVWQKEWPITAEVAGLLLRAAVAFEVSPKSIPFGGRPLSDVQKRAASLSIEADARQIDLPGSLRSMYPSFQVANWLSQADLLAPGVSSFIKALELPADIRPIAYKAVGATDLSTEEISQPPTMARTYHERQREDVDTFEGFVITHGPLTSESGTPGTYASRVSTNPVQFFQEWASDENLRLIPTHSFDANGWAHSMHANGVSASPTAVLRFIARRLELDPSDSNKQQVRSSLEENRLHAEFRSEACVPMLLRLAKASGTNVDRVRLAGSTPLKQAAAELGLHAAPRDARRVEDLVNQLASDAPQTDRLDVLTQLTANSFAAPSFSELMRALLPYVAANALAPLHFDAHQGARLVAALTTERHPLAVAALAAVFLAPSDASFEALKGQLSEFSSDELESMGQSLTRLRDLSPDLKAYVYACLVTSPPGLTDFETRLMVASSPFTYEALADFYRDSKDPAGLLRAVVERARLTGTSGPVVDFLREGVARQSFKAVDLTYAFGAGAASREAQAEVLQAVEALATADVIGREAARHEVRTVVARHAVEASPEALIRDALLALYERDLRHVASLREAEAVVGPVKGEPFKDQRTIAQRLGRGSPSAEFDPRLHEQLSRLKARVALQQWGASPDELAQAAVDAGRRWLEQEPEVDPTLTVAVLTHLEAWALAQK